MSKALHIIILAAGDGTRMKSDLPKVLQPVGGRPMLAHVYRAAKQLGAEEIHIVYNPETPQVRDALDGAQANWVPQEQRLGTGHAVQQAMPGVPDEACVLVLYGDLPLLQANTLNDVRAQSNELRVLTMMPDNPTGYGRIVRDQNDQVSGIVEEKDANESERKIREVNSGIICAGAENLRAWLDTLGNDNSQGEYYLTDVIAMAYVSGQRVLAVQADDPGELEGANDQAQLAELEAAWRARQAHALMMDGVRISDPTRVDIRGEVSTGRDVHLDVNVVLEGVVRLGDGVSIGAGCVIRDSDLAAGTRVHPHSVVEGARTTGACDIGPFARVRPGTQMGEGSRVGNFVEVKNTALGRNTKASHLTYLGDSQVGDNTNIGAGTITCNYDGVNKHRTEIGSGVFVGSDTQLIAPVSIGDDANIGAGSTITKDVPAGKLTLSRSKQVTVKGWKRPEKEDK